MGVYGLFKFDFVVSNKTGNILTGKIISLPFPKYPYDVDQQMVC